MIWTILILSAFFLAHFAWLLRNWKRFRPVGLALSLLGSVGILVLIACSYISTLPSHSPLRTVIGLATHRSSVVFNRRHWDFILVEERTGQRFLFHTAIDGPWEDQPVLVTYVDDGRLQPSVVRIEILSEDQVPWWHVEKGHAGWIGTAEAKRRAPFLMYSLGLLLIILNVLAPLKRTSCTNEAKPELTFPEGI
jgi:hypothetical protein